MSQTIIYPLQPMECAVAIAKLAYEKWQEEYDVPPEKRVKFEDDLVYYLTTGFVVSRPSIFWMGTIVDLAERDDPSVYGKLAWFIRVAVGNLEELYHSLPCQLPYIVFCRRGDERRRIYSQKRFGRLAIKFGGLTVERAFTQIAADKGRLKQC